MKSKENDLSNELLTIYNQMKNNFYQRFRDNLSTGESQLMQARTIIGTEILLENRPITQSEIEKSTKLARSLISDALSLLVDWKMVRLIKISGERKKHYMINFSWDGRLINRLRVNRKYASEVKDKIAMLIDKAKLLERSEDNLHLLDFLQHIQHSYHQFTRYIEHLELKFLKIF